MFVNAGGTAQEPVSAATARSRIGAEASANKDASGGYTGLTLFKINFKNALGTLTSFFTNSNTVSRTYTFPDADGTVALTGDMPPPGGYNCIINGDFQMWERADTHSTSGYGSDDRWKLNATGSPFVHSKQSFTLGQTDVPDNPRYYSRTVITTSAGAANFCNKEQRIESVLTLSGGNARLSFYCKADAPKNIAIELVQNFGTTGTPSAEITGIEAQKIAVTASWAKYEVTLAIPSIAGKTLGTDDNDYLALVFWFDAGTGFDARTDTLGQQSGTFELSHIQLESGSVTSVFQVRTDAEEDERCARYYTNQLYTMSYSGDVTSGQAYVGHIDFATTMRAAPSATLTNTIDNNFPAASGTATTTIHYLEESRTADGTGMGHFSSMVELDAEL